MPVAELIGPAGHVHAFAANARLADLASKILMLKAWRGRLARTVRHCAIRARGLSHRLTFPEQIVPTDMDVLSDEPHFEDIMLVLRR